MARVAKIYDMRKSPTKGDESHGIPMRSISCAGLSIFNESASTRILELCGKSREIDKISSRQDRRAKKFINIQQSRTKLFPNSGLQEKCERAVRKHDVDVFVGEQ